MEIKKYRFSASIVKQGKHRFYSLTMPSDILANTCFVSTREEDPIKGFQRLLDIKRAQEIADYIDNGFGSIPNSIVLSAQLDANFTEISGGKTIQFDDSRKAFLILDGQHRVFGFSIAKTSLRIPVIIYNGLTRTDESRLFIDINTKQRPVPPELLLDIKNLAKYESSQEQMLRTIFDLFNKEKESPLLGLLSPSSKTQNKISRVTFNGALKPLIPIFNESEPDEIYTALSTYITAFLFGLKNLNLDKKITNAIVFRSIIQVFPEVAQRVKDKYGAYSTENFIEILSSIFNRMSKTKISNPGNSIKSLSEYFSTLLKNFKL